MSPVLTGFARYDDFNRLYKPRISKFRVKSKLWETSLYLIDNKIYNISYI